MTKPAIIRVSVNRLQTVELQIAVCSPVGKSDPNHALLLLTESSGSAHLQISIFMISIFKYIKLHLGIIILLFSQILHFTNWAVEKLHMLELGKL